MPTYGFPDRGSYDRTRDAVRKVNREFPAAKRDPKTPKEPTPFTLKIGKTDAAHAKGSSGTISVWTGPAGSETDSGKNITAFNRFADLGSGKWVVAARING